MASNAAKNAEYFAASRVAAAFGQGPLAQSVDYRVEIARRAGPGEAELHEREVDVFYILDGEATFITGGEMQGKHQIEPGQWRGTGIEGGEAHQLKQGDVIVVPAGLPHSFQSVPAGIDYFVVKVIH